MPGPLKTEAIVLRSLRYGEADRILHLYTPQRGRLSAIAKGVRKARSRFGGRLEPFFRLQAMLHEGRSELLTVTGVETVAAHPRLREHGPALDVAARCCDAVDRLFATDDPHPGVYALLSNELALLEAEPDKATPANAIAFRLKLLLAAGLTPHLSACASCGSPSSNRRATASQARAAVSIDGPCSLSFRWPASVSTLVTVRRSLFPS